MAKATKSTKEAVNDVFGSHRIVETTTKSKAKQKKEVEFTPDFETFVRLSIVKKAIEDAEKSYSTKYKNVAIEYFAADIEKYKVQPKFFTGISGDCSAQFQYKNCGFKSEIAEILDQHEIEYTTEVKEEEKWVFDNELLSNPTIRDKVALAIQKIEKEEKIQLITKIPAKTKFQFTDNTFEGIATKISDPEEKEAIIREIATLAIAQAKVRDQKEGSDLVAECLQKLANDKIIFNTLKKK